MKLYLALALAATLALPAAADVTMPTRTRGTLLSASATAVTVRTLDGQTESFMLTPGTHYVTATKASLADVRSGRFIGTATKDVGGQDVALEVAIFPDAMRGAGAGHYPWDEISDTTAGAAATVHSSMTNGNVTMALPARRTASSMTNGNIQAVKAAPGQGMETLTISYPGGTQTVLVPPTAAIVLLAPADAAALKPGASVFVVSVMAKGQTLAVAVMAGKDGTRMPM